MRFKFFLFAVALISIVQSCHADDSLIRIVNPYDNVETKIRQRIITHEHIGRQDKLEAAIDRGIDIICISNYSPAVPFYPLDGYSIEYQDWQIVQDRQGNILYETDKKGEIKTINIGDNTYKIPVLEKVKKTVKGGFRDFKNRYGDIVDVSMIPQLPNAEHTHYSWPVGSELTATKHLNFIGTMWPDVCNGTDEIKGLTRYNSDNGYSLSSVNFRSYFPLWSITEMLDSVRNYLLFPGKVFGTINHPGNTGMEDKYIDAYMEYGKDIFKGIEIYNNSDTPADFDYNIECYDRILIKGNRLWCVAVNDWGIISKEQPLPYKQDEGCNLLYLDISYAEQTPLKKAEMALDALIEGSFSAVGFGTIDLSEVKVEGSSVTILFDCVPDRTVIDIDGNRSEGGNVASLSVTLSGANKFVRFEAYKGDDFIFTQPFFVE